MNKDIEEWMEFVDKLKECEDGFKRAIIKYVQEAIDDGKLLGRNGKPIK